jgi:hypothetical protein
MKHGRFHFALLFAAALWSCCAFASEPAQLLRISWPAHWEYREPQRQGPAVHLQAREQLNGQTTQRLEITAIDVHAAQKPITRESIQELASRLRDAALATATEKQIPLRQFANDRGYYFIASDSRFVAAKVNSFKQMIEGAMLDGSYLINFTLLTNDAGDEDARSMVDALGDISVATLSRTSSDLSQKRR